MLIDAHTHLDMYDLAELPGVLAGLEERSVLTLTVSVDPDSYRIAKTIAAGSELVVATFGIHPWQAPEWVDRLGEVEGLIAETPIIGEVGLDHRFVEDPDEYHPQRLVFAHFLTRAAQQAKIVNLHCSGAEAETLEMLRAHGCDRAIVHWYSGPLDVLADMISHGLMFSVGVEVLTSDHIRAVAAMIPAAQLLTETDNPGGHRWLTGEVGMPSHLELVVEELARVRGVGRVEIESTVHANVMGLLGDDPRLAEWAGQLRA